MAGMKDRWDEMIRMPKNEGFQGYLSPLFEEFLYFVAFQDTETGGVIH